jgi:hypothetical protein
MIERRFGKRLMEYEGKECIHKNKETNNKVAVIVETREAYFLPHVIKNICEKLGDTWNLHIFVNEEVLKYLKRELPDVEYRTTLLLSKKLSIENYSYLLRSKEFWRSIKEEKILIFQTDTYLFHEIPEWVLEYDFIGAPCGVIKNYDEFTINGGLSIRSKKAMIECSLEDKENNYIVAPEDVYFSSVMRGNYKLPNYFRATEFSTENINERRSIGIHGTDKYYF